MKEIPSLKKYILTWITRKTELLEVFYFFCEAHGPVPNDPWPTTHPRTGGWGPQGHS